MACKDAIASCLLALATSLTVGVSPCAFGAENGGAPATAQTSAPRAPPRAAQNQQASVAIGAPSRVALVIGNSAYESLPRLTGPSKDAQDICAKLKSLQFDTSCQFDVPDRVRDREILESLLNRARQASTVVFYFSGHGVQVDGENYLLPTKVAPLSAFDLVDEGMPLGRLLESLSGIRVASMAPPSTIVIIDAARDSTLEGRPFANLSRGLARIAKTPAHVLLLLSAAPGKTTRDAGDDRSSVFARDLLRNLGEPGMTIEEVFQRTRDQVENDTSGGSRTEQVPSVVGSLDSRLCMAGCDRSASAPASEEINKQLDQAMRRIRELEADKARNVKEQQDSAQLVARLEADVRVREQGMATVSERDRQKEAELADLRAQLANARSNQRQLDQMGAAVQKAKELQEANVRLSQEKQDAVLRVANLQAEIASRAQNLGQAGELNRKNQEEILRLRADLDNAKSKQYQLQEAESRAKANDDEISSLRSTIAQLKDEQVQREREYTEQQKKRDDEYKKLVEALKSAPKAEAPPPQKPAEKPRLLPMPAGF